MKQPVLILIFTQSTGGVGNEFLDKLENGGILIFSSQYPENEGRYYHERLSDVDLFAQSQIILVHHDEKKISADFSEKLKKFHAIGRIYVAVHEHSKPDAEETNKKEIGKLSLSWKRFIRGGNPIQNAIYRLISLQKENYHDGFQTVFNDLHDTLKEASIINKSLRLLHLGFEAKNKEDVKNFKEEFLILQKEMEFLDKTNFENLEEELKTATSISFDFLTKLREFILPSS